MRDVISIEPREGDDVGVFDAKSNRSIYIRQPFLKLTYNGEEPLTHVLMIGEMHTTGATAELTARELGMLQINSGGGSAFTTLAELMRAERYLETMPKTTCCYIARIRKGDVIRLPLGRIKWEAVTDGAASCHCDQGYLPEVRVPFIRKAPVASRTGKARRASRKSPVKTKKDKVGSLRSPFNEGN